MTDPDPRTDADNDDDATNHGQSTQAPAEGEDDADSRLPGSPKG